jgi:hypothetical protein
MRPNIIPAIASSIKKNKSNKMSTRKLSEHVEAELFNKEKRVTTPKIKKESNDFLSKESKTNIVKTITDNGDYSAPVKKRKPYYRKKYNKPTPVEVITPEPNKPNTFITGLSIGIIVGVIITSIVETLMN